MLVAYGPPDALQLHQMSDPSRASIVACNGPRFFGIPHGKEVTVEPLTDVGLVTLAVQPLLLLPGVSLLIGSTSQRFTTLHHEVHHLEEHRLPGPLDMLLARARLFRWALFLLYGSVAALAFSGLLGALTVVWPDAVVPGLALTFIAIVAVLAAAALLVTESSQSLAIVEEEIEALRGRDID